MNAKIAFKDLAFLVLAELYAKHEKVWERNI